MSNYRSNFEKKFHKAFPDLPYENLRLKYVITHTYTPDFQLTDNVFLELKGLWDSASRSKHLFVRKQNPNMKVLFIFMDPNKTLNRKSKTTYASWCVKNNFDFLHMKEAFNMSKAELIDYVK